MSEAGSGAVKSYDCMVKYNIDTAKSTEITKERSNSGLTKNTLKAPVIFFLPNRNTIACLHIQHHVCW